MELDRTIALVTGGSSGIGLETARQLKAGGARVAICARRSESLLKAAEEIGALPIVGDVGVEDQASHIVGQVIDEFGGYNVLVNNAGFGRFASLLETDLTDFENMVRTNVFGAMLMARESARYFIEHGGGSIVNVASTAALKGFPGGTGYAATKFALSAMTECWRAELRSHDIRVMQINPSEVQTEFAVTAGYERRPFEPSKLQSEDIAHAICAMLTMNDRGFTTDMTVFATNPS